MCSSGREVLFSWDALSASLKFGALIPGRISFGFSLPGRRRPLTAGLRWPFAVGAIAFDGREHGCDRFAAFDRAAAQLFTDAGEPVQLL
jgi:hypothetical protein